MSQMSPDEWNDELFGALIEAVENWRDAGHTSRLVSGFPEEAPIAVRFQDPTELIELADSVAPRLVYGKIDRVDDDEIALLAEQLADSANLDDTDDDDEEADDVGHEDDLHEEIIRINGYLSDLGHATNDAVGVCFGFAVDGVFLFSAGIPEWFVRFLETALPPDTDVVTSQGQSEQGVRLMKQALAAGLVEKVLADHRALGAISNADLGDAFWAVAIDLVPELEPMIEGDRRSMRYALYTYAPDLSRRITARRIEIENDALGRIDEIAREFLAEPGVASATTLKVKEPLAARFVERTLGFRCPAVASQIARWKEPSAQGRFTS